jgi:malonyl-CoA/methylmalonyl-CoA synthetase
MPDPNPNLYRYFRSQLDARAQEELLSTETDRSYLCKEIDSESARLADFISRLGLKPGDRVSVQVEKTPEALCLYLACLRGGFVFHPLNPGYQASELEYFLGDAEPVLVVCDSRKELMIRALAIAAGVAFVHTLDGNGGGSLMEASRDCAEDFGIVSRRADDLAALLYSSGTTGKPKGIMLTHGNLLSNAQALIEVWGFTWRDRLLHALPIFHVHGLFVAIGCVLLSGASMRWLSQFNVGHVVKFLPECTVMMGVPTYYTRLLAAPELTAEICDNMRVFISGSAPLLPETFGKFEARTGHQILERYGMTETNMITSNPLNGKRKPGTVGLPLPGVEVRLADDSGKVVPLGEVGNIQVRGPNVFAGYWNKPEKTAEDFTGDGFFNTGDKGQVDEDGYLAIVGRAKDVVITGGLNVYPREIELFVDHIAGVRESAVIGVPHPDFGEAVVAVVVCEDSSAVEERHVLALAKEHLAGFKVPKRVVFVKELPRNTMAKVQKSELRERYRQLFSGTDC